MATNLQVNASTQQAVGAFAQLTASINSANSSFQQLTSTLQRQNSAANTLASGGIVRMSSAIYTLRSVAEGVYGVMQMVATGIQLVFSSLVRELDKLQGFNAIMSVTTSSADAVGRSYQFVRETANRLGVQFDGLATNYAKLVAAIPAGVEQMATAEKVFTGVAMAARTLHASNTDTQLMFYAITQMASKGVVSMEELRRQLGEKLPGVIQIAAKAVNTLPETLEAAIRKGIVSSEKFLPIFGEALIRTFGESSEKASSSVSAAINRLTNVWVDFVKEVLDSGAGNSIIGIFDALRSKLEDPYVMARFAEIVKDIATRFTEFINSLTQEQVRDGFDALSRGIDGLLNLMDKLIKVFQWVIDNGPLVGAIVGGVAGASMGAVAGPYGALAGGAVGSIGGYAAGGYLSRPDPARDLARIEQDRKAREAANNGLSTETVKYQMMLPMLSLFKGLNTLPPQLMEASRLNVQTVEKLRGILEDKRFKTDADRANAVKEFARTGYVLAPATATLADVTQPPKPKSNGRSSLAEANSLQGTLNKAMGFNSDYTREQGNLNKLLAQGRLNQDEYNKAFNALLEKQPFMVEAMKAQKKEFEANNKALEEHIGMILRQIDVKEELRTRMDQDLKLAGMSNRERMIESQLMAEVNRWAEVGLDMSAEKQNALREELRLIQEIAEISSLRDSIEASTTGRYLEKVNQMKAVQQLMNDPKSGFGKMDAQEYLLGTDQNFTGSQEYLDIQRKNLEDYYAWINGLRNKDLVSARTAEMMKAKAAATYDQVRLQQHSEFFSQLSQLSRSGNSKLAAIGRAAAATQATIDGVLAVQKALASAPPPLNYVLAAAVGVTAAANVAQILGVKGFYGGGYTGDGARGGIAGVVHGQEFVSNASATAANRPILEAMNRGQKITGGSSELRVTIEDHTGGVSYDVQQISPEDVRIIAQRVVRDEAPQVVGESLRNPNSAFARSVYRETTAQRNM